MAVVALFGVAGLTADTEGTGSARHPAVEERIPEAGSQTVRQAMVGVDLELGWTAELEINRTQIPRDQLEGFQPDLGRVEDGLGRVLYDPGQGKVIEVFPQGQVCVTAYLTRIEGADDERGVESWCFTAT